MWSLMLGIVMSLAIVTPSYAVATPHQKRTVVHQPQCQGNRHALCISVSSQDLVEWNIIHSEPGLVVRGVMKPQTITGARWAFFDEHNELCQKSDNYVYCCQHSDQPLNNQEPNKEGSPSESGASNEQGSPSDLGSPNPRKSPTDSGTTREGKTPQMQTSPNSETAPGSKEGQDVNVTPKNTTPKATAKKPKTGVITKKDKVKAKKGKRSEAEDQPEGKTILCVQERPS